MELEEAVIFLKKVAKEYKTYGDLDNPEFEDTKKIAESIEKVLQALKNSILKKKIEEMLEDYQERKRFYEDENIEKDNDYFSIEEVIEVLQELLENK